MNYDSYFSIGAQHKVCQDYSSQGLSAGLPYVIVSDGCSSSPNTDIGSRIVSLYSKHLLESKDIDSLNYSGEESFHGKLLHMMESSNFLRLPNTSFDATLLTARVLDDESYVVTCFGDGVIARLRNDGSIKITTVSRPIKMFLCNKSIAIK